MKAQQPSPTAYAAAAWMLSCAVAAIRAVAEVESRGEAFNDDDTPPILFERHYFHRMTGGRFDKSHPHLSNASAGGYGKASEQHAKLAQAIKLEREPALMSASWGMFQIMGANWRRTGHHDLQSFVNAMYSDVDAHLRAFVWFIATDEVLTESIRAFGKDEGAYAKFARRYNGPGFRTHKYDERIAVAWARITRELRLGGEA